MNGSPDPAVKRSPSTEPPAEGGGRSWPGWIFAVVAIASFGAWDYFAHEDFSPPITYSAFYRELTAQKVARVEIRGQDLSGEFKEVLDVEGRKMRAFRTILPEQPDAEFFPLLRARNVHVEAKQESPPFLAQFLLSTLPLALVVAASFWLLRQARSTPGGGPLAMLRGHSHRFERESDITVRFDDVAGLGAAKQDLQEIVLYLKEPERFRRLGGKIPRGVLLVGPPGTGKTLIARAVAGEAGVPFFSINGSEFIELYVGVGAARVRELFAEAKKVAPAIVFIDEIDAVGRSRGAGLGGGHDEREQTLNQLLSEMDGFSRNDLTIVLAATNRPDVLDSALLRPGRFDRRVVIDRPELQARRAILRVHTRGKPLAADVDLDLLARDTPGFSGADLANLVNEAALSATRRNADAIAKQDVSAAQDKIVLGDPREAALDSEERRRVAIHEGGHAVVAHFSAHAEPVARVSIIPRGMALGATQQAPGSDKHMHAQRELEDTLRMMLGGLAAEKVVLGDSSSGAESDLKRASELAFKMVAHWGMSEKVGPMYHEHRSEHPFLGQVLATEGGTSDRTVHLIESEARAILTAARDQALKLIGEHRAALERLVDMLLEHETLEHDDIVRVLGPREAGPEAVAAAARVPLHSASARAPRSLRT